MIVQILKHTPPWVFILFFALLYFGYMQSKPHSVSRLRLAVLPVVMMTLSLLGIQSLFKATALSIGGWICAVVLTILLHRLLMKPGVVCYFPETRLFSVPGSWTPLALMLGIFFTKYAVAVSLALNRALLGSVAFVAGLSMLYGHFSGMFIARAIQVVGAVSESRADRVGDDEA